MADSKPVPVQNRTGVFPTKERIITPCGSSFSRRREIKSSSPNSHLPPPNANTELRRKQQPTEPGGTSTAAEIVIFLSPLLITVVFVVAVGEMPEFRSRRMVTPLKIGFGMRRRMSSPAYSGNGGGGGVRRPNRAVKRCRSVEDDKENTPPLGYTRSVRKSPLPDWYPRTPLRDITAIVNVNFSNCFLDSLFVTPTVFLLFLFFFRRSRERIVASSYSKKKSSVPLLM